MNNKRQAEKQNEKKSKARAWAEQQSSGFEPTAIKLPEGVEFFKFEKPGIYKLDFMPYVAGKWNKHAEEGEEHFELTYDVNRIPMPDGKKKWLCCRGSVFGKKDAVVDWLRKNGGHADPELVKALKPSTRHLWVVNDKPGDEKNPLKVLDTNHYNKGLGFGEQVATAITSVEAYETFYDLENGYTLQLTVREETFPGGKFMAVSRIDFLPRKYSYSPKMLKKAPCLDDCLIDPGYDEVTKLLEGDSTDDDEDETPVKGRGKVDDDDDDDDDAPTQKGKAKGKKEKTAEDLGIELGDTVEHPEHGQCKVIHVSGDGTSLRIKDEDGEVHKAIDPNECEKLEPDDEEEEKPKGKKGSTGRSSAKGGSKTRSTLDDDDEDEDEPKPKAKNKKPTPDDDDDDDDDEEDEPKPKSKKSRVLDDDDDDDPFNDDDDEDEGEPAPKLKGKKPKR